MTLLDAFEPLFERICELNRLARSGESTPPYAELRRELSGRIETARNTLLADPSLEHHWAKLEMPVIFFVDSMISESGLPAASEWNKNRLAYDFKELAGDQKFFDLLDEQLKDPGADASVRLGFFYTCLGLGFTGYYFGRPEQLRPRMIDMIRRVDPSVRNENHLKICPEAYENVDTRNLIQPPPLSAGVLAAFFGGLCLVTLVVTSLLYQDSSLKLRRALAEILTHSMDRAGFHIRINL